MAEGKGMGTTLAVVAAVAAAGAAVGAIYYMSKNKDKPEWYPRYPRPATVVVAPGYSDYGIGRPWYRSSWPSVSPPRWPRPFPPPHRAGRR